jgi:hypothetical protein
VSADVKARKNKQDGLLSEICEGQFCEPLGLAPCRRETVATSIVWLHIDPNEL